MESPRHDDEPHAAAAALLHEMLLRARRDGEEPELSSEERHYNDQLQQDEMLALDAIYGDNIGILSAKDGLQCFQVHVHCEIPDGISVSAELSRGNHDQNSRFFDTFSVQHLAPISLTCLMPPSYPSHHALYFTLSSQWLDTVKVSSLCLMLDRIWSQQLGLEVVYGWVQWLQSSALSHLGFDDGIVIRQPDSMMGPVDVRVLAEIASIESVVQWLISYNEEQCHESFLSGLHDCMICLTEHAGIDIIKLPCRHYFCRRCMEMYSRMHVAEGTVLKLLCPDDKCGGIIPPSLLKRMLGDKDFERWERLTLQKTLDSMSDVAYCPRCGTACLEDEENNAQCSKCFFTFCTCCRDRRHIGERCISPEEQLLSLQDRNKVRQLSKGNFARRINLANEISSIKEVLRSSVLCPHCGTAISRVSGCNHMLCSNCRQPFCYGCGKPLHHGHSSEQCRIDQENLARETLKVNPSSLITETKKELVEERSRQHPCPTCRQLNPKMGKNNHIFCWACQVHYCALCHMVVRKSSEHYRPRGCKQHSVDP